MKKSVDLRESGMALVFAIGLLALMLAVGLAFVGNSIIFKKVAVNNSSRTQSRMLALSAGENVLWLVPPLNVSQADCERAVALIEEVFAEDAAKNQQNN